MNDKGIGLGYILIVAFLAYVTWRFWSQQQRILQDVQNRGTIKPGVSYYCRLAVSQRPQQVTAAQPVNSCMATVPGYYPAFGPAENVPSQCQEVWF